MLVVVEKETTQEKEKKRDRRMICLGDYREMQ